MFASLLAASLASSLGLVGCTRTDCDICPGFTMPNGSVSWFIAEAGRPFARAGGAPISGADIVFASGCGEWIVGACNGDSAAALPAGVGE